MRLSEAIFLGSKLGPQRFGNMFEAGGTCALGAAYAAIGKQPSSVFITALWPWVGERCVDCPACGDLHTIPMIIATHLNDLHEWSRERIADWVATIEPKETPTEQPTEIHAEVMA